MTVTPLEFEWREWVLGEGRYKGLGPKSKPRPTRFPLPIPLTWWGRLTVFLLRRRLKPTQTPAYTGLFTRNGAFLRNPRGGVENVAEMRAAGMRWVAINVGDHTLQEWGLLIDKALAAGLDVVAWARVRSGPQVHALLTNAQYGGCVAAILDHEDEAKDVLSPSLVMSIVYEHTYDGEVAVSTVGWMFNAVDWTPYFELAVLLQWFWGEVPGLRGKWADCLYHARQLGCRKDAIFATHQAYPTDGVRPDPAESLAGAPGPISVFAGDDVGVGNWSRWQR